MERGQFIIGRGDGTVYMGRASDCEIQKTDLGGTRVILNLPPSAFCEDGQLVIGEVKNMVGK